MDEKPLSKSATQLSPWVTVVERTFADQSGVTRGPFHSLQQHDYVSVLALTEDQHVVLVRQYRPALEKTTLELPGGLLDSDVTPADCAQIELLEESGYRPTQPLELLGCLDPDTGRLENRYWAFFAPSVIKVDDWKPELGIDPMTMAKNEFLAAVADGEFITALHITLVGLARLKGRI